MTPDAAFWASDVVIHGLAQTTFTIHAEGSRYPVATPLLGQHVPQLALPAAIAARALGIGWDAIIAGLADSAARVRVQTQTLANGVTLIDDSYNAAPRSVLAALDLLAAQPGRRVAVLADMLELGSAEQCAHAEIGEAAPGKVDLLVAVGKRAQWIAAAARAAGMPAAAVYAVADVDAALSLVAQLLASGDILLIKGSRAMELNRLVEDLLAQSPV
jgi:UDP-N-acetylmuramoyl-tripeptide--D-alanyl-D-alanine ligase